jgi:hypothetical protein
MIPLISSLCYGPLEVCQLPRLWWKVTLRTTGLLDEEYPEASKGLDAHVIDALGLDQEQTLGYIRDSLPDYLTFEAWVTQKRGEGGRQSTSYPDGAIDDWNAAVRNRIHDRPAKIEETYRDIGWSASEVNVNSAIVLNSVQDWQLFYKRDFDVDFSRLGNKVVPLISTLDYGRLEVCQLPRTWLKILLRARNLLHDDYPDMTESGLDPKALAVVGIEPQKAIDFIRDNMPSYIDFEAWVLEQNGGHLDTAAVQEWNEFVRTRDHNEAKQEDIKSTIGRDDVQAVTSAVILNHIEDMHLAHQLLVRRA